MSAYTQFVKDQFAVLDKTLTAKERMIEIAKLWREKKGDTTGAKPRVKKEKVVIKQEKIDPVVAKVEPVVAAVAEVKPKKKRASKKKTDNGVFFLPLTKEIPCH